MRSKSIFVLLSICVLAACSGQGSSGTSTAELVGQSKTQALKTEKVSLLDSLAKEYPNGKLPAERAVQAAMALSQNPSVFKNSAALASQAKASAQNLQSQVFTAADFKPVYRIQNTTLPGSYFFTIYDSEKTAALAANPNWQLEGTAFYTLPAASTDLKPVYRFRNKLNGSYLYTAYESEKTDIQTNYSATFELEGVAWRAQQTPAVGYSPLYRFRNLVNGTYLNTAYESEKNAIVAQYPDIFSLEGIAYYVLTTNPMAISGTAATGAPFPQGSKIEIIDATGAVVGDTIILNPEGSYNVVVPANSQPPLIIKATADGATTMYSVSPALVTGTVNVTPITNLIAARLSPTGNPANLAAEVLAGTATVTTATTTAKTQEIVTALAPLSAALSVTTDPLTGTFVANGTGYDQLLDSVKVKITPTLTGAVQGSNIDVTVVTQQAPGAAPIVIPTFSATAAAVPPLSVATIPATTLVVTGTATKVRDLVAQIQTCYALPVTDRIALNGTLASDITAPACRGLFLNSDPTTYKNNGFVVSATSQFSGIFKSTSTGALFDLGSYEFTRTNGDIVFSYRSRSADTLNTNYNTGVARLEGTQLKLIGNQWNYDAAIKPTVANRTLPNDPTYSWQATGYNIFVANKVVGGNSIFNKVIVTSPNASTFTLKPTAGLSYMVLESSPSVLTNSNLVFLNGNAIGSQSLTQITAKETGQFWSNFSYWTDTQISSLSQRGVWKYEFYLAANATATPDTTEYRSTFERAPTVAELKSMTFAKFTDGFINGLVTQSATTAGGFITMSIPVTLIGLTWEVPLGALAPIQGFISGRAPYISASNLGNRFDDTVNFGSSIRNAGVACATQSLADLHCNADGNFAVGTRFNYMHVKAITSGFMDVFSQLGLYKPSLN
jgi:Repeat of unknown function (DUF5648)